MPKVTNSEDPGRQRERAGQRRQPEHRRADRAGRGAVDGEDQDDEEEIDALEDDPAGAEQRLEEALIVAGRGRPREQEGGDADQAEQRHGEQHRGDAAPRAARQEEFGELAPGRIAAADHHRLEGEAGQQEALEEARRPRRVAGHQPRQRSTQPLEARAAADRIGDRQAEPRRLAVEQLRRFLLGQRGGVDA